METARLEPENLGNTLSIPSLICWCAREGEAPDLEPLIAEFVSCLEHFPYPSALADGFEALYGHHGVDQELALKFLWRHWQLKRKPPSLRIETSETRRERLGPRKEQEAHATSRHCGATA
jgi:hypothetical protein